MNPYTTMGQFRIRQRDIATILRTNGFLAAGSLAALERQRAAQADAEVWRLQQYNGTPHAASSLVALLRQRIGTALIRAGESLAGTRVPGAAPQRAS